MMHSASFGPILGPITTLTSLANFKARSLPTPRAAADSPDDSPPQPPAGSAQSRAPAAPANVAAATNGGHDISKSNGNSGKDAAAQQSSQKQSAATQVANKKTQGASGNSSSLKTVAEPRAKSDAAAGSAAPLAEQDSAAQSNGAQAKSEATLEASSGSQQEAGMQRRLGQRAMPSGKSACGLARLLDSPRSLSGSSLDSELSHAVSTPQQRVPSSAACKQSSGEGDCSAEGEPAAAASSAHGSVSVGDGLDDEMGTDADAAQLTSALDQVGALLHRLLSVVMLFCLTCC